MDKRKAKEFLEKVQELEEKYGIHISSDYQEDIDYDYEENPYISGGDSYLILVDKEGFEISVEDLENEIYNCYYCGRVTSIDSNFCNTGCRDKYYSK